VVDGWPSVCPRELFEASECTHQDSRSIFARDVPASEYESPHLRRLQREAFELSIADALIAGQDDPVSASGFGQPLLVRSTSRKVIGQAFDRCARFAKRFGE